MCLLHVKVAKSDTQVNGSVGWTKKRKCWLDENETKSGDETTVETAILNVLNPSQMKDTLFLASGDCIPCEQSLFRSS